MRAWSCQKNFFLKSLSVLFLVKQVHRLDRNSETTAYCGLAVITAKVRKKHPAYNLSDMSPPHLCAQKGISDKGQNDDTTGLCVCVVEQSSCMGG